MGKTRAGAKSDKKAAKKKAASAKAAVKKTVAKKPAPKKAPAKKPAAKPAKKAPAKKPAAAKAAPKPAPKAEAKPAAKAAPKPAPKPAPKAEAKPAAPKVAAKKSAPPPEAKAPAKRPSLKPEKAEKAEKAAPVQHRVAEAVIEEKRPSAEGPVLVTRQNGEIVGAHPDAQLTAEEINVLYEKLVTERERVVAGFDRHLQEALGENEVMPDETDMAQRSTEQAYLIRFADKERKLLSEIEHALEKMRSAEYGVCEGTEEAIGFKRLELRPWTRYSVAYKEQMEKDRLQHRR
jgi:DnaK suppressor protein